MITLISKAEKKRLKESVLALFDAGIKKEETIADLESRLNISETKVGIFSARIRDLEAEISAPMTKGERSVFKQEILQQKRKNSDLTTKLLRERKKIDALKKNFKHHLGISRNKDIEIEYLSLQIHEARLATNRICDLLNIVGQSPLWTDDLNEVIVVLEGYRIIQPEK